MILRRTHPTGALLAAAIGLASLPYSGFREASEGPLSQWRRGLVDPGTRGSAHAPRRRKGGRR